ncbi:helix-turn-helix transcriptional regulator [Parachitinimonas caeni]|uniref:WYL domain-containing protein n=1 Tax=Parachitinimonas caeni TaxID=3031301 RepID=A0ABT7DVD3_9NEIS|nr:WYL domain-containing protein [Parachitinimonas caeni]MDK2123053.1 WYL domain-containing protein [Parachitinimonas caeni]
MSNLKRHGLEQPQTKVNVRWGQDRRLAFIDFRLQWDGHINRGDLTEFFGISIPQASLDIARYTEVAPQNLAYDRSSREYRITENFQPISSESQPQRYLSELLGSATGILDSGGSFIGWSPPVESIPRPGRIVEAITLAAILKAIRVGTGLKIVYQSMSRPEPSTRIISPHALANDGFRWHVRAYCHLRCEFRDFVLGRILEVHEAEPAGKSPAEDTEWNKVLTLVLAPHPELSSGKRRAIEMDYGMRNGEVKLQCRQALLFYTLRSLGLENRDTRLPEVQQIIIKNQYDIDSFRSPPSAIV